MKERKFRGEFDKERKKMFGQRIQKKCSREEERMNS